MAQMIDSLQRVARSTAVMAVPALVLATACLATAVFIVFTSSSHEDDRFLFPSILGFAWFLSLYGFIETFRHVPASLGRDAGFWRRARRSLSRFWYWIIALALLAASAVVLVLSVRTLLVWLNSYSGGAG
jgi:hypothetical protein